MKTPDPAEPMGALQLVTGTTPHSTPDDAEMRRWVRRAQEGDVDAFERLYRSLKGRIFALCLRMTADEQEAEERLQDTFVKAWERLHQFRGDARFSTWLHRVAVNVILEARRSASRRAGRELTSDRLEAYGHAAVRSLPGTRVDLERAIAGLPDGARKVLVLRDVHGYPYQEIAEITGVTLGTVKAQIHRARALVQKALNR